jgi:iron complex transport system substrate-binding protein
MQNSREGAKPRGDLEEVSAIVVDGYKLHVEAGPGLLEAVYEVVLARMLVDRGLVVKRQVPVPIRLMGMTFEEGFRADLLVEDRLLIELKSVENLLPVHAKQVLTYLRLLQLPLGLLINFGAPTFKDGCKRIVNHHRDTRASRLRVNQEPHAKKTRRYRKAEIKTPSRARETQRPGRAPAAGQAL